MQYMHDVKHCIWILHSRPTGKVKSKIKKQNNWNKTYQHESKMSKDKMYRHTHILLHDLDKYDIFVTLLVAVN